MLTCLKQTAAPRFYPLLPWAAQEAQGETAPRLQPILFSSLPRLLLSSLTCMLVDIPAYKTGPSTLLPHSTIPGPPHQAQGCTYQCLIYSGKELSREEDYSCWKPAQGHGQGIPICWVYGAWSKENRGLWVGMSPWSSGLLAS